METSQNHFWRLECTCVVYKHSVYRLSCWIHAIMSLIRLASLLRSLETSKSVNLRVKWSRCFHLASLLRRDETYQCWVSGRLLEESYKCLFPFVKSVTCHHIYHWGVPSFTFSNPECFSSESSITHPSVEEFYEWKMKWIFECVCATDNGDKTIRWQFL